MSGQGAADGAVTTDDERLIIVEAARAHPSGISSRPAILAFDDACIPGYRRIAEACHAHDCKVFGQLAHPGREMSEAPDGTFAVAHAPSPIPNERFHVMPREMPAAMIQEIVAGFGAAIGLALAWPKNWFGVAAGCAWPSMG